MECLMGWIPRHRGESTQRCCRADLASRMKTKKMSDDSCQSLVKRISRSCSHLMTGYTTMRRLSWLLAFIRCFAVKMTQVSAFQKLKLASASCQHYSLTSSSRLTEVDPIMRSTSDKVLDRLKTITVESTRSSLPLMVLLSAISILMDGQQGHGLPTSMPSIMRAAPS